MNDLTHDAMASMLVFIPHHTLDEIVALAARNGVTPIVQVSELIQRGLGTYDRT